VSADVQNKTSDIVSGQFNSYDSFDANSLIARPASPDSQAPQ